MRCILAEPLSGWKCRAQEASSDIGPSVLKCLGERKERHMKWDFFHEHTMVYQPPQLAPFFSLAIYPKKRGKLIF